MKKNMCVDRSQSRDEKGRRSAFTLVEVVLCIAIVALVFGTIILGYTQASKRAQWSGYSLAAEGLCMQSIEQARSGVWDPSQTSVSAAGVNEITNLVGTSWAKLDLPMSGTNFVIATNYVNVQMKTNAATVFFQMITVQTVWPFRWGANTTYYTNTLCTYCAPDNRANNF